MLLQGGQGKSHGGNIADKVTPTVPSDGSLQFSMQKCKEGSCPSLFATNFPSHISS